MSVPIYTFDCFRMRAFSSADALPLHRILNDAEVTRYMPFDAPLTLNKVQKFVDHHVRLWQKYGYGWWTLETLMENEFIGWCGLEYLPETNETEVGYLLHKESWGRGMATLAAKKSLEYGFTVAKLNRIVGLVHPENAGSIRVLEKIGMHRLDEIDLWGMHFLRYQILKT